MRYIDPDTWPRRAHCDFFARVAKPFYSVSFPLDVTEAYAFAKRAGLSFYYVMIWLCTRATNRVEAFRYKLRLDGVVLHDFLSPSFTFSFADDLFGIVNLDCMPEEDVCSFCARAARAQAAQTEPLPSPKEDARDDQIYFSCLPWFSYYHVTQESTGDPNDSTPRLMWGKFEEKDGRRILPMTAQVNHRLIDGIHIHRLKQEMEKQIAILQNSSCFPV